MTHSLCSTRKKICVFVAVLVSVLVGRSDAQTSWMKFSGNPVLDISPPGQFDSYSIYSPMVIFDDGIYKMWYTSSDGSIHPRIAYATSSDGITWQKHGVVLTEGTGWEAQSLDKPFVIRNGDTYQMWYSGHSGTGGQFDIGYATSPDGVNWTKHAGNPVLSGSSIPVVSELYVGSVLFENDTYTMWFSAVTAGGSVEHIRRAISQDGISWIDQGIVFEPDVPGSWDAYQVWDPYVLHHGGIFHMWYGGISQVGEAGLLGYATSPDGITWTRSAQNPVLLPGAPVAWDDFSIFSPTILLQGSGYEMWFAGNQGGAPARIGYATTDPEWWKAPLPSDALILYHQTFETFSSGNPIIGWSNNASITAVDAPIHTGLRAAQVTGNLPYKAYMLESTYTIGAVVIEAAIKADPGGNCGFFADYGTTMGLVAWSDLGYWWTYDAEGGHAPPFSTVVGDWHTIKATIHLGPNPTYDVDFDENRVATGSMYGYGDSVFRGIALQGGYGGPNYLDDLRIVYFPDGIEPSPAVTISLPDVTATYNESIQVPVRLSHSGDPEIVSAELFVSFSSGSSGQLLPVVSSGVSAMGLLSGWSLESNVAFSGAPTANRIDTLKMAMATDDDPIGDTGGLRDLLTLSFQVGDIRHPATASLKLEHVLFNDGVPGYLAVDGSIKVVGTDGAITSQPSEILPRWSVGVSVYDLDEDRDSGTRDAFAVGVVNGSQTETLTVTETGNSTGAFTGTISTVFSLSFSSDDGIIQAKAGDQVVFSYADSLDSNGDTQLRTDVTDVLGGTDGVIRVTVVSQPGDTVRVRVSDADLSDAVAVSVANPRTGETESIVLSQFSGGSSVFYGRFFTAAQAGAVGDSTLVVQKGDVLSITYADTLTANGGTASVVDDDEVVDPFGDADGDGKLTAYDAHLVLRHRLLTYGGDPGILSGLDSLSANVDQGAPFGIIDGYDASLILQKVVGLISRFEVQEPDAVNHPQPETELRPKPVPEERRLALVPGDGYVSVWCENREEIVSGELTLAGVQGQVVMGEELQDFLTASQMTENGLQVVFAGSEAVSGPGELLRVAGVGPGDARLTRVSFNGGRIGARWEENAASAVMPASFALYPNVPNPFNPETTIRFDMAQESQVRLEVFDVVGQRVRVLVGKQLPAGAHQVLWDGRGETGVPVSSGVYFCRLQAQHEAGEFRQVRRMLLLK